MSIHTPKPDASHNSARVTRSEAQAGSENDLLEKRTNRVLTIPSPRVARIVEKAYPSVGRGYAIVEIAIAPICVEARIWAHHQFEIFDDPDHLGHEGVGTVVEAHPDSAFQRGDRVIVFFGDSCGKCYTCVRGLAPVYCERSASPGPLRGVEIANFSPSGGAGFSQFRIASESSLYRIPEDLDFRHAAAAQCMIGNAYSTQQVLGVEPGAFVLLTGVGTLGLSHVISALYRDATPIVLVRNQARAALARQIGAIHVLDPDDPAWVEHLMSLTDGVGARYAVECSGLSSYQRLCLSAAATHAKIGFVGFQPDPRWAYAGDAGDAGKRSVLEVDIQVLLEKQLTLLGTYNVRMCDRDGVVAALLDPATQRRIDTLVTHEFPMSEAATALDLAESRTAGKIYLYPQL